MAAAAAQLNRYHDPSFDIDAVKLLPGECYVTCEAEMLVTVLGSCVSVCLRDRSSGIGGMNHFMLPSDPGFQHVHNASARYGVHAMDQLVGQLIALGGQRRHFEAKVFGGGSVLKTLSQDIGQRNVNFILEYLRVESIPLVASDLLDIYPRKIYFFPYSGRVLMRRLHVLDNDTLLQRERTYRRRLAEPPGGSIDLF